MRMIRRAGGSIRWVAIIGAIAGCGTTRGDSVCEAALVGIPVAELARTFAAEICAQKEACGCGGDRAACEAMFITRLDAIVAFGHDTPLVAYDGVCAARMLRQLVAERGCATASEIEPLPCPCTVFQGESPGRCTTGPLGSDIFVNLCEATASCREPTMGCQPPEPTLDLGARCWDQRSLGPCAVGTACDAGGSQTCIALRAPGEPCEGSWMCASFRCLDGVCVDYVPICEMTRVEHFMPPYVQEEGWF